MRRVDPLERERFKSRTSAKGGAWTLDLRAAAWLSLAMSRQLSRFLILLAALACSAAPALAKVGIRVDLGRQRITIVKNNEPPIVWKISSGRPGYETPTGRFIMQRMDADHLSDEYDQAPMPYAIFFSRGLAIHGTTMGGLGRPASHGCVRLSVDHALDLYEWVEQYGAGPIEITGDATSVAQLQDDEPRPRRNGGKRARRRDGDDETPVLDRFYDDFDRIIRGR
jgi:hypothetical protein